MRLRTTLVAAVVLLTSLEAVGQGFPWRASLHIGDVGSRDASSTLAGTTYSLAVDPGTGIELAAAYRLTPFWEVELSALKADIDLLATSPAWAAFAAGSTELTVVTLALQYRFFTTGRIRPYVGFGAHLASLSGLEPTAQLINGGISSVTFSDAVSVTAQAGVAFQLNERWAVDLRGVFHDFATDAEVLLSASQQHQTMRLDVDPWLIAAGIEFRF